MTARLVNVCTRPVEVRLSSGVVVVAALSSVGCDPRDLERDQVRVLCDRGVLVAQRAPVPEQPPAQRRARRSSTSTKKRGE
ncbi:hypothetical protein ACQPXM_17660 [Kribbella sp. CA-253562]|uniref:hypothetical protein n=1 Tax=Kribbella sp. CA-253562 TaxID=3239942 RepID=UPI003D91E8B0